MLRGFLLLTVLGTMIAFGLTRISEALELGNTGIYGSLALGILIVSPLVLLLPEFDEPPRKPR